MSELRKSNVFWIEAEPISGGSQNQTEVPKEAGPFFGGSEDPSGAEEIYATFSFAGSEIEKKVNFRPSGSSSTLNGMWRVNLPTAKQAGPGSYANKIVVFKKIGGTEFNLSVLDMNDDQEAISTLKRQSDVRTTQNTGNREYGYK